jgi:hypothetical protein
MVERGRQFVSDDLPYNPAGADEQTAVKPFQTTPKTPLELRRWPGAPSGFRTPDPLIKSQLLYQLS